MNNIEERLERIESENKNLRKKVNIFYASFLIIISFGFTTGYIAAYSQSKSIRVNELIIEDSNGIKRASFGITQTGDVLQKFYEKDGTVRINHGILKNGTARHRMFNEKGKARVSLSVFNTKIEDGSGITIYHANDERAIDFSSSKKHNSYTNIMQMHDNNHKKIKLAWKVASNKDLNQELLFESQGDNIAWQTFSTNNLNGAALKNHGKDRWLTTVDKQKNNVESGLISNNGNWGIKQIITKKNNKRISINDESKNRILLGVNHKSYAFNEINDRNSNVAVSMASNKLGQSGDSYIGLFDNNQYKFLALNNINSNTIKIFGDNDNPLFALGNNNNEIINYQSKTSSQQAETWLNRGLNILDIIGRMKDDE